MLFESQRQEFDRGLSLLRIMDFEDNNILVKYELIEGSAIWPPVLGMEKF